ncbi:cell division transport system permease protein [Pseudaminobacter salicylatoxidans]|uniref:Cell division transport system permease protein n=1 Tax=Pseudaminobacter salicylatoxidans TaxID=93369 RepID=A0A316C523_PSESE|nr:ABC transporter permease [Pseudaminobacter salicylatoxidans]PWJ84820.1 cell division transport system permease protein [Pseudaminobacter salicylatoxidans]
MTEPHGDETYDHVVPVTQAAPRARVERRVAPIVPPANIAGRALVFVIAIMTFLSCLTLGAVTLVRDTASVWQNQIAREATIQVKPVEGVDMDASLEKAARIASQFSGVRGVKIVDRAATARLLEPWLGSGLDIDELPVPRLVIVTIDQDNPPDFNGMRQLLQPEVPGVSLDDHRTWVDRLVAMAHTTVTLGMAVLVLMLSATVLTVVFATRGAMAGNGHIIEVLHYVGAEARFIAREFRRHFLLIGMKGAAAGGAAAMVVFVLFWWWSSRNLATPQADQATALFGNFSIGAAGYAGAALVVALIGVLTAATSHVTVVTYLNDIDVSHHEGL